MSTLRAYGKNVLIFEISSKSTYGSGLLVVPDNYIKRPVQGIVSQVGPRVRDIKVGDHVIFDEMAGISLDVSGRRCWLFPESAINAKIVTEPIFITGLFHQDDETAEFYTATLESALEFIRLAICENDSIVSEVKSLNREPISYIEEEDDLDNSETSEQVNNQ